MLYTGTNESQAVALMIALESFAEGFTKDAKDLVEGLVIDLVIVRRIISAINENFPYVDGVDKASAFKKAANLMAHIIKMKPITKVIFTDEIENSYQFSHVLHDYDPNALYALHIAIYLINSHKIERKDGVVIESMRDIALSQHSYADILEALSSLDISPKEHYKLLALLLEQTFYKTNPHCQYPDFIFGPEDYIDDIVKQHRDQNTASLYAVEVN